MLLIGALVIFLLFTGLGFVSHILWLGLLVGAVLLVFHLLRSGVDTATPGGRLNLRLLAAARGYLDDVITAEGRRTRRTRRAAKAAGNRSGTSGATRSGSVMTPAKIEAARELADAGLGATAIAQEIGVSRSTVYRYVSGDHSDAPTD